ncbi:hypothetical protein EYF80_050475 [Liparis tanakae]|uniref:Uncharacterized protein n=1 Tax=Liparis tanakae TaxID=230148 RepID=A0A4Z2FDZ7_9TELE|nr:hypothetical protein EYF80_050475 [Liparis tanakae]
MTRVEEDRVHDPALTWLSDCVSFNVSVSLSISSAPVASSTLSFLIRPMQTWKRGNGPDVGHGLVQLSLQVPDGVVDPASRALKRHVVVLFTEFIHMVTNRRL